MRRPALPIAAALLLGACATPIEQPVAHSLTYPVDYAALADCAVASGIFGQPPGTAVMPLPSMGETRVQTQQGFETQVVRFARSSAGAIVEFRGGMMRDQQFEAIKPVLDTCATKISG